MKSAVPTAGPAVNRPEGNGADAGRPATLWIRVTIGFAAVGAGTGAFLARALTEVDQVRYVQALTHGVLGTGSLRAIGMAVGLPDAVTLLAVIVLTLRPVGRLLAAATLGARAMAAAWVAVLLWQAFGMKGAFVAVVLVWLPALALLGIGATLLAGGFTPRSRSGQGGGIRQAAGRLCIGLLLALPVMIWQTVLTRPMGAWLG